MEKIIRPKIDKIKALAKISKKLEEYNLECKRGERSWSSSGDIYKTLRNELSVLTIGHCSFCDFFPLNDGTKKTIEHYYPKSLFQDKTYDWDNLFLCCDKCQSNANKVIFEYTLKPDDTEYYFDKYFYFDPQTGKIEVMENLKVDDFISYQKAEKFLIRYGINDSEESLISKRKLYNDLIFKISKKDPNLNRDDEPRRFIFDLALMFMKTKCN